MAEKVSRDRGYRSDTIALSRDLGPLRTLQVLRALSMPALQREAAWGEERLLGDLRQLSPRMAASIYTL